MHNQQRKLSPLSVLNEVFETVCLPFCGLSSQTSDSVDFIKIYRSQERVGERAALFHTSPKEVKYLAAAFEKAGITVLNSHELVGAPPMSSRAYSVIAPTAVILPRREAGQDKTLVQLSYADYIPTSIKAQEIELSLANDKGLEMMLMGVDGFYLLNRKAALVKALSL